MFDYHALARDIEASGLERHKDQIGTLAGLARRGGVSPVLIDVMTDASQPEVARVRALARIQLALSQGRRPSLAA